MKIVNLNKTNAVVAISTFTVALLSSSAYASPIVSGNVISWTDEGWHQVQLQSTYESVCNGGRQCTLVPGVYTVINHGTGERFPNIAVPGSSDDNSNAPAPVAATGQDTSYAFGDDGDFQAGVSVPGERFQDNGDGTFSDTLTGITWLGRRDCIVRNAWGSSVEYANTLAASSDACPELNDGSVAGDWRLPNIKELYTLADISDAFPALAPDMPMSGEWTEFPSDTNFYWSSSSFKPVPDNNAFVFDSGFALIWSYTKSEEFYAWPIRVGE